MRNNVIKKIQETDKFRKLYNNKMFFVAQLLIAMFLYVLEFFFKEDKQNIKAVVSISTTLIAVYFFVVIVCIMLITIKDIKYTFSPFFLASMFIIKIRDYNVDTLAVGVVPAIIVLVLFMILKRIVFPVKFKSGELLLPILLLSLAIFFGGLGQVSVKKFFNEYNFAFLISLSVAPLFAYWYILNYLPKHQTKKENENFLHYFMFVGLFTLFILFTHIFYEYSISPNKEAINLEYQIANKDFLAYSMMIVGVFPFYYAMKEKGVKAFLYFLYGNILFIGAICTTSKLALFIGGLALFIMIILSIVYTTSSVRYVYMGFLIGILFTSIIVLMNSKGQLAAHLEKISLLPSEFEKSCYKSGFENLINFPFLGTGIQNISSNSYKSYPFINLYLEGGNIVQLFGAVGFVGVACILYLIVKKFTILIRNINKFTLTLLMSYIVLLFTIFFTSLTFMFIPVMLFSIIIVAFAENTNFDEYNKDEDKLLMYKELINND